MESLVELYKKSADFLNLLGLQESSSMHIENLKKCQLTTVDVILDFPSVAIELRKMDTSFEDLHPESLLEI